MAAHGSPHSSFDVRTDPRGDETTISITGRLDATISPILQRTLENLDLERPTRLVLDLGQLDFIDAGGLRLIVALNERCLELCKELQIRPGPAAVRRVLEDSGAGLPMRADTPPSLAPRKRCDRS
jgi:anti-anti-sigma factor